MFEDTTTNVELIAALFEGVDADLVVGTLRDDNYYFDQLVNDYNCISVMHWKYKTVYSEMFLSEAISVMEKLSLKRKVALVHNHLVRVEQKEHLHKKVEVTTTVVNEPVKPVVSGWVPVTTEVQTQEPQVLDDLDLGNYGGDPVIDEVTTTPTVNTPSEPVPPEHHKNKALKVIYFVISALCVLFLAELILSKLFNRSLDLQFIQTIFEALDKLMTLLI